MICLRDVMSRDAQLAMGRPASHGNFYHLYVNGQYWGLYNSDERPEAAFGESYIGGVAENYDTIKVDDGYVTAATDGNMAAWTRLWQAATNGFSNDDDYYKVQGLNLDGTPNLAYENLLDIDNLIDYMFVILYGGNLDAPISNFLSNQSPNNWYGIRDRSGTNGGFRFMSHDAEHTLLNVNEDRTGPYPAGDPVVQGAATALSKSQPQYIWTRLQQNAEFRLRVADHLQKNCFNGGPLSVDGMRAMFLSRSNEIQRAIVGESARWGDARVASPLGRANWVSAIMNVYNGFMGGRTTVFLNQMRADNMWPTIVAPVFNSPGGVVQNGFRLFMTNLNGGSTIYYTLNAVDPRMRGGGISSSAVAYTPGTPIIINYPTIVRARVLAGATWSPITEATFYTGQDFSKLICTEIMYNPLPVGAGDDFEFVELKNVGTNPLIMTGMGFDSGITFSFTNGTSIAPGQFLVLGRHRGNLQARYPGLIVHGIYTGRLDNGGERLSITNILGTRLFSVEYKDSGRWPLTPDGRGFSLVSRNPNANANPNNPSSWRASTNPNGSPGADDPAPTAAGIVINEALTHTDAPTLDSVELYNPTASPANIGGWFLTDDPAIPAKYRIPDGTTIAAGGYLMFDESHFNPTPETNNSFALDSEGDQIYLFSGDANTNLTGYSHGFSFDAAPEGVAFGRYVLSTGDERFVLQKANTPAAANAGPLIGDVVIRQIMYHPPDLPGDVDNSADEYVELRNRTINSVHLYDPSTPTNTWHLRGGIDFDFPQNVTVGPSQSLVLVNFDPNDITARDAFLGKYGAFSGVPLFGP
ncbi:MAG TPA: lamin tail domain-containing protein, partial [Candidatus Binatia bacterium]|nr:lamin tail domain-containing protein [Candidatus Binatia bacterium]